MRQRYGFFCSLLAAIALSACQPGPSPSEAPPEALPDAPELVFRDARVMDPESGLAGDTRRRYRRRYDRRHL